MRKHYVLVDFENVQIDAIGRLDQDQVHVLVFVGANQTRLPYEIAAALQRLGTRAQYVKIAGNGPNALDFHIAFHIGSLVAEDRQSSFHIVSKDTGFDPLIAYLAGMKIRACRAARISDIRLDGNGDPKAPADRLALVEAQLARMNTARPRTVKTLSSTIAAVFHKQLPPDEVEALVTALERAGRVIVTGTKVSYP